jgi:hypothetical protein
MALNFPDAPTGGQEWTDGNGITWVWDGEKWLVLPDPVETLPEAPNDGAGYWRKSLGWSADPLQADAPNDANTYGRKGNAWTAINLSGAGTFDHNELTNRTIADQHPVGAITGLQTALDGKAPSSHTHTLAQITDEGSMAAVNDAPADGTYYTRRNNAWSALAASTLTHNDLGGRSTADAHPISAVTGLQTALDGKLTQAAADPLYVNVGGDTMTGALNLPAANPTTNAQAAHKGYVDEQVATRLTQVQGDNRYLQLAGGTMTGQITLQIANPTLPDHAAKKSYCDTLAPWQGANKFVSTVDPTAGDGADGDIWFTVEA